MRAGQLTRLPVVDKRSVEYVTRIARRLLRLKLLQVQAVDRLVGAIEVLVG